MSKSDWEQFVHEVYDNLNPGIGFEEWRAANKPFLKAVSRAIKAQFLTLGEALTKGE